MSICLAMIVKDEAATITNCLRSALPLVDSYAIVDTGSTDDTKSMIHEAAKDVPGVVVDHEWLGYGPSRNVAMQEADGADWVLMLDSDMTIEAHPDLRPWLEGDPDPQVVAWNLLVEDHGLRYRLPLLTRGGAGLRYEGVVHEYVAGPGKRRSLLGLTVTHHSEGRGKVLEQDLGLLEGLEDSRSVFYRAQTLRFLGRTDEAIGAYRERVELGGWDEELWYSQYQAAVLAGDVDELLMVHRLRPWRHEPLTAAARIVAARDNPDILFNEVI